MKVIISVGGRFHAFNLAHQLVKRDLLYKLITSYPRFEVKKYGIPSEKVDSIIIKEILERGWRKLPNFLKNIYNPQFFVSDLYDKFASRHLEKADLFVGWSSFSLHTLRKAKKMDMVTVLDHGSSHIKYQDEILREEYEKFGLKAELAHSKVIEKEIEEYQEADYIAIPSLFSERTFLERGVPHNKLIRVPYGVDLTAFRELPKDEDVFRVIYAGGMTLRKGIHYLLQAFSELKLPKAELLLIGAAMPEIKPFFKKYEGYYRWIGSVPQSELYKYYSQSSVFVLNSIEDGFGMVIIQAMACGLPVIATQNTGGPDIIRDGVHGFIIPIRDVEALKQKLLYLYEAPSLCEEMGRTAKARVQSGFSWNDYGQKMIIAYKRMLGLK